MCNTAFYSSNAAWFFLFGISHNLVSELFSSKIEKKYERKGKVLLSCNCCIENYNIDLHLKNWLTKLKNLVVAKSLLSEDSKLKIWWHNMHVHVITNDIDNVVNPLLANLKNI